MTPTQLSDLLARVRKNHPLVHHITNYVTVNDCANITICAGGAPIMADAIEEVAKMTGIVGALVLNIGTLNCNQIDSMIAAGHTANEKKIPIIFDPVGAGATRFRTETARRLLEELDITILKGNTGEIGVLAGADGKVRGVDSAGLTGDPIAIAKAFAARSGLTVAVSGPTDIVTDGRHVLLVENGHPMMGGISGTGCMAASVTGAFAAESDNPVQAAAAALAALGIAGERAAARSRGPYSFKVALFDELSLLTPAEFGAAAKLRSV